MREQSMKLILSFAASAALASLAGCSQANQDDMAANVDSGGGGNVLPIEDNAAGSDSLGNQLNQLNESTNAAESSDSGADSAGNASGNATNSY
jgi:hypothetical protein